MGLGGRFGGRRGGPCLRQADETVLPALRVVRDGLHSAQGHTLGTAETALSRAVLATLRLHGTEGCATDRVQPGVLPRIVEARLRF
jgi:hypothetical protein